MKKYLVSLTAIIMLIAAVAMPAFSQEDNKEASQAQNTQTAPTAAVSAPAAPAASATAPVQEPPKMSDLSIYGEVQSVNAASNSLTVQYYDYDNDQEKTIEITLDKDTKLENAKALSDLKKGDWADVTYTAAGGKNVAKLVSVEKEEPAADENAPAASEE